MSTWWTSLSWSHALLVALLIMLALGGILLVLLTPHEDAEEGGRRPWPVVDYSAQRNRKIAWLGDRYLLSRPINRKV